MGFNGVESKSGSGRMKEVQSWTPRNLNLWVGSVGELRVLLSMSSSSFIFVIEVKCAEGNKRKHV
jgi:hypothetical protein